MAAELLKHCHINTNEEGDCFVGIKGDFDHVMVCFPIGYRLPQCETDIRRDILRLFQVLSAFCDNTSKVLPVKNAGVHRSVTFPINAYLEVIMSFLEKNGYYVETVSTYKTKARGKTDWSKTVQRQKPLVQPDGALIYTKFTVREQTPNMKQFITHIHRYCVFESFKRLGWMFTPYIPEPPMMSPDTTRALAVLNDKLQNTNNDRDKRLFKAMKDMLESMDEKTQDRQVYFGTEHFEIVWERLIDHVFGIKNKKDYFPRAKWLLSDGKHREKKALQPDTIMLYQGKIYVLDAKYYRYGVTGEPNHLPDSASINKQITYGEYIHTVKGTDNGQLYNAFLMPYNMEKNIFGQAEVFGNIGEAVGEWRAKPFDDYERVQGIVVDVRYLMYHYAGKSQNLIGELAERIERALDENSGRLSI